MGEEPADLAGWQDFGESRVRDPNGARHGQEQRYQRSFQPARRRGARGLSTTPKNWDNFDKYARVLIGKWHS